MKKSQGSQYILIIILLLAVFLLLPTSILAAGDLVGTADYGNISDNQLQAYDIEDQISAIKAKLDDPTLIKTVDKAATEATLLALEKEYKRLTELINKENQKWTWEKFIDNLAKYSKIATDTAYKAGLKYFLNTLAVDTATYLATGDQGQGPMFETRPLNKILTDAADGAAGAFLETLGKDGPLKFNLCKPNLDVMVKINLGLQKTQRPTKPSCTFSEMTKNWDTALKDKDFLPKFQDMFNPWSNDLGIALTLQTGLESEISNKVSQAVTGNITNQGIKPVTDPITGNVKTPVSVVRQYAIDPITKGTVLESTYTGSAVADAIDIFINTLAGKLLDKWLKKGIVTNFPERMSSLTDINAQNPTEGVTGAENRFRSLTEPSFKVRGDYEILGELVTCPNPNKAGPTNCVIDEKFRQAIEKRLTVKQAMDQGYLSANGVFGFTSDGLEPAYNEGYPYRSMLILRKF
ncbi:MAG: hypothetical protein Q8Q23_01065, partial [bacterium]|nr:hypothetical protein [bacterium]